MTTGPSRAWQEAASYAARAHRHQMRRDARTPYAAHPFRVALTLRHAFGCEDEPALVAALLHDTIEDTGADYDELCELFGAQVADLVAALTKNMALPETQREADYDARLARADWRARLIKLADVYDNACDWSPGTGLRPEDMRARCDRALLLASADASRAETSRAIALVREIISRPPLAGR